jgi:hypothetical protein
MLRAMTSTLASDKTTRHYAHLDSTMRPLDWRNFLSRLVASAERLYRRVPQLHGPSGGTSTRGAPPLTMLKNGMWSEVRILSASLRMAGRIDLLEKQGNSVTVRDYKSGGVLDQQGNVKDEITKQLWLYGLAVIEALPDCTVRLIVDNGAEHVLPFGSAEVRSAESWLSTLLSAFPAGNDVAVAVLARPGPPCHGCPIRHVCLPYHRAAVVRWQDGAQEEPLPSDIWGVIRSVSRRADGARDIDLVDASGRRVRVNGLDDRHDALESVSAGDPIWIFGLMGIVKRGRKGEWLHPRNFWELPSDSTQDRAWSTAVFAGPTGSQ